MLHPAFELVSQWLAEYSADEPVSLVTAGKAVTLKR
jgi:hypothetical protein